VQRTRFRPAASAAPAARTAASNVIGPQPRTAPGGAEDSAGRDIAVSKCVLVTVATMLHLQDFYAEIEATRNVDFAALTRILVDYAQSQGQPASACIAQHVHDCSSSTKHIVNAPTCHGVVCCTLAEWGLSCRCWDSGACAAVAGGLCFLGSAGDAAAGGTGVGCCAALHRAPSHRDCTGVGGGICLSVDGCGDMRKGPRSVIIPHSSIAADVLQSSWCS
jgi:hypothetical protein